MTADYTTAGMTVGTTVGMKAVDNTTVEDTTVVNTNKMVADRKVLDKMADCRLVGRMVGDTSNRRRSVDRMADRKVDDRTADIHSSAEDGRIWPIPCCALFQDISCALTVERKLLVSN